MSLVPTFIWAQTYQIKSVSQRINNKKYDGYSSKINGSYAEVKSFWLEYLKQHGKIRRKRNYYQISEFSTQDLPYDTLEYLTMVKMTDSLGTIWFGLRTIPEKEEDLKKISSDVEKFIRKASRDYYVSVEQKKLDDAEQAAMFTSKNHQKLIEKGQSLGRELAFTQALKTKLEGQLENAILKIKVLNQQIIDNKEATQNAYDELENIKGVIEGHKEKLRKIH